MNSKLPAKSQPHKISGPVKSTRARALLFAVALGVPASFADAGPPPSLTHYADEATQVMEHVQKTFWDPARSVYTKTAQDHTPDYVWRQAAAFSALLGAARHDPATYRPILATHFHGLEAYWDTKAPIPGYEPAPTRGNGHDKYYDDNAWLIITFLEAFELTHERPYLTRAQETARFVLSGWDDKLGGGIWWHSLHKDDSKNTCADGPAAVGFLYLARVGPPGDAPKWLEAARKTVEWTTAKLQATDGLFDDRIIVNTGEVKRGKLTYNSALMLRANLDLYRQTGRTNYLDEAKRIGKAADFFCDKQTGLFRDPLKWSHFMVEADLDLYRTTPEEYLLRRARTNADAYFAAWKKSPPLDMMSNVATARILYLLAEAPGGA
jgi:hypothetical protein